MYTAARLASTGRAAVFSLLHLLCQKGRCHCNRLALGVLRAGGAVLGQQTRRPLPLTARMRSLSHTKAVSANWRLSTSAS